MLEHYFCLIEFKSVFEFICLISFEKWQKQFLSLTTLFLCFWPIVPAGLDPTQPTRSPPSAKAGPRRLPPPAATTRWGPAVIPDLWPDPEPQPSPIGLDPASRASSLGLVRLGDPGRL
jgi:hypothetical protein